MTAALSVLAEGARSILGRSLEGHELQSFGKYLELLQKWQKVHRLVGSTDPRWIVESLFLDSLLFLRVLPTDVGAMADLGSGAGFPGIPIKIVRPELEVTLIESRQRRVSFLSTTARGLGLARIRVVGGRAESLPDEFEGSFGAVVMRCAGDAENLLPHAKRLLAPGGMVVLSGPPDRRPLTRGEWVEVPSLVPGRVRRFAVYRT